MNKQFKIFGEELIEQNAIQQFLHAFEAPWVVKSALMPDAHMGIMQLSNNLFKPIHN